MHAELLETARELHSRVSDRIHVRLLWLERDDRVVVEVDDAKTGERFMVDVPERSRAMHVFHHPFAYAGGTN